MLPIEVARGNLDAARTICEKWKTRKLDSYDPLGPVLEGLYPLLEANNRPALARQLHEWEAYSVKQLGLEKIWEPTPFPLELDAR